MKRQSTFLLTLLQLLTLNLNTLTICFTLGRDLCAHCVLLLKLIECVCVCTMRTVLDLAKVRGVEAQGPQDWRWPDQGRGSDLGRVLLLCGCRRAGISAARSWWWGQTQCLTTERNIFSDQKTLNPKWLCFHKTKHKWSLLTLRSALHWAGIFLVWITSGGARGLEVGLVGLFKPQPNSLQLRVLSFSRALKGLGSLTWTRNSNKQDYYCFCKT